MSHGHESGGSSPAGEAVNFIFKIFSCFWEWLDDDVSEMIDKPHGGHGHH
jgi:hypothetical protein